jgi:hypothetical protein
MKVVIISMGRISFRPGGSMIESGILTICKGPKTNGVWALSITELQCRPLEANSIKQAAAVGEEVSPYLIVVNAISRGVNEIQQCHDVHECANEPALFLIPINNRTHTTEACMTVSREEYSVE